MVAAAENLVGLRLGFPLFLALAVFHFLVDPRQQRTGQREAEVFVGHAVAAHGGGHLAVDVQNRAGRVGQFRGHVAVDGAHLGDQLTHVLGAGAGRGLVGLGAGPLHQVGVEQAAHGHQHQAHGAVAADEVTGAFVQRLVDHLAVDRVQHDDAVVGHAQRRGGVDPVAFPAGFAELGVHLVGVIAALAGDDHVQGFQFVHALGVAQGRNVLAHVRAGLAHLGGGKEHRFDVLEIIFRAHAVHQYGTDHAAPADKTDFIH